jgi:hypothetical protein
MLSEISGALSISDDGLDELVKVTQSPLEDAVYDRVIEARILVHQEVAEPGHVPQSGHQTLGYNCFFAQDNKHVLIILRRSESFFGDEVMANVQAGLNCRMKGALYRPADQLVLLVFLKAGAP